LFDEDDVVDEIAADASDDSPDAKRRLRRFKQKRISENKLILETMDRSVDGKPPWIDVQEVAMLLPAAAAGFEPLKLGFMGRLLCQLCRRCLPIINLRHCA